jgi:hypothetical protein
MDYCWQCYAPYAKPAVPAGVSSSSGTGTPTGVVAAGPLAHPSASAGSSTVSDALRGPAASPPPVSSAAAGPAGRSSWVGPAIKVGVFLVVAVAGFFAWRIFFGGFSFPDEINRQPRMDGEAADRVSDFLSGIGSLAGADIEVAVYGEGPFPAYVMARTEFEDAATVDLLIQTAPGFGQLSGGGLACAPDVQGSSCSWLDGDRVVMTVGGFAETPEALRPIAEDVREDLG